MQKNMIIPIDQFLDDLTVEKGNLLYIDPGMLITVTNLSILNKTSNHADEWKLTYCINSIILQRVTVVNS